MSAERNAAVVRRWVEDVMSGGQLDLVDELVADSLRVISGAGAAEPVEGARRRARAYITAYRSAFPDLTVSVDDLVACEDSVTLCWTSRGTHLGHFSHPDVRTFGLEPTGRAARWSGISLFRLESGRIVETRSHGDIYGLLRQLELVPPLGRSGAGQ